MSKRILLTIAYDGTDYAGWQRQDNALAIEEVVETALSELTGETVDIIGASRTDAGVHAYGNTAIFDTDSPIPAEKFGQVLNGYLPDAIRVMDSCEVDSEFHPRYADSEKTYQYHILNTDVPLPMMSRYATHIHQLLDVDRMRAAASCLIGEHDFTAFCAAGAQVKSKVRTIYSLEIDATPLYEADPSQTTNPQYKESATSDFNRDICIRITGNGFLYNMVRIIAGTLIEVGLDRYDVSRVELALQSKDRSLAGPTAPAKGLILEEISYV